MLSKGTKVAGYRIEGVIGHGGMGVVYEATHLYLERPVALKLISGQLAQDSAFKDRFRREGRLQAALDHPHIVTVYEASEADEGLFLAIKLINGPTLKELVPPKGMAPKKCIQLLGPIADALDFAHGKGLVHRDLKPQNILVGPGEHPYLADFGLTRGPSDRTLTKSGQFVGTVDYVSPEQIEGRKVTAQSDTYSLAAVMYECLTGEVPYPKDNDAAVIYAHMADKPPLVSTRRKRLPDALNAVITKGLAKDPKERFTKPSQLVDAATAALGTGANPSIAAAPSPKAKAARPTRGQTRARAPMKRLRNAVRATTKSMAPPGRVARGGTTVGDQPAPQTSSSSGRPTLEWSLARRMAVPAGVVIFATAGFLAISAGRDKESVALAEAAKDGNVGINYPSDWERSEEAPPVPGMSFEEPVALQSDNGTEALIAGTVAATGPELLPGSFLNQLSEPLPTREAVELGDVSAYRYAGVKPEGSVAPMDVLVVPTAAGVVTLACFGTSAGAPPPADCDQMAQSLEVTGTQVFAVGPDEDYAAVVNKVLSGLDTRRTTGRRALRNASTREEQAAAGETLRTAFSSAATEIAASSPSPEAQDANARIGKALGQAAAAYSDLATSASNGSPSQYAAAGRSVQQTESSVRDAVGQLKSLGYHTQQ